MIRKVTVAPRLGTCKNVCSRYLAPLENLEQAKKPKRRRWTENPWSRRAPLHPNLYEGIRNQYEGVEQRLKSVSSSIQLAESSLENLPKTVAQLESRGRSFVPTS